MSDPSDPDTDGDGLDDGQEVNGWEITLFTSHQNATMFRKALFDDEHSPDDYDDVRSVESDPQESNSDGDDVDDLREKELGTDPEDRDSDDDQLGDGEEVQADEDPTMFDVSPPEITITRSTYNNVIDGFDVYGQYLITAQAEDPSGVDNYTITVDGETFHDESVPGGPSDYYLISENATVGLDQALLNGLQENKLRLRVGDRFGNVRQTTGYSSSNFYIEAGRELGALDSLHSRDATALGVASGIASSSGSMGETFQQMFTNPREFLSQLANIDQYVQLARNIEQVPALMAQTYQNEQRTTNPYYDVRAGRATHDNADDFAKGYYVGILMFEVALSATGTSASSKFKKIDQVQDAASQPQVSKAIDYYQAASRAPGRAVGAVSGAAAKTGVRVARWTSRRLDGGSELARTAVRRAQTAGRQWEATKRIRRLSDSKRDALESRKDAVADYVSARGEAAVEVLTDVDSRTARRLFDGSCSAGSVRFYSGASVPSRSQTTLCGDELRETITDLAERHDYESGRLDDLADNLRGADSDVADEAAELVRREGDTGAALANDVLESDLSESARRDALELMRDGGNQDIDLGPGKSREQVVENLDEISDADGLDDQLEMFSGNDNGYKGIAGEASVARRIKDKIGLNNLDIGEDIPAERIPDDAPLDDSEIDVKVDGEVTINGRTMDSPAIESKHLDFSNTDSDFIAIRTQDLRAKLVTWAKAGEDDIVLVLPEDSLERLEDAGLLEKIEDEVQREAGSDVDIEFTSYEDL